jgi:hypothetical protein
MPQLTRRRDPDAIHETWRVYYGDIQVGTIGLRAGVPTTFDSGAGAAASIRWHIAVDV